MRYIVVSSRAKLNRKFVTDKADNVTKKGMLVLVDNDSNELIHQPVDMYLKTGVYEKKRTVYRGSATRL